MGYTLPWPPLLLFTVTFFTALTTRSFRTGLVTGVLAMLAGLVAMMAVAMAEAAHWYDVAGVYLTDGDYPTGGLDRLDAILDPVEPGFIVGYLLVWAPWLVLGTATGSWLRRRRAKDTAPLLATRLSA